MTFVEGDDLKIVSRLCRNLGLRHVADEDGVAVLSLGGFSNWRSVEPFKWFLDSFLEKSVEVHVLLDRDYRSDAESSRIEEALEAIGIRAHVWRRKELENYLLVPSALARVTGASELQIVTALTDITDGLRDSIAARRSEEAKLGVTAKSHAVTLGEAALREISKNWPNLDYRLSVAPGKAVLAELNHWIQTTKAGKPVSPTRLAQSLRADEVDPEWAEYFGIIEQRAQAGAR